MTNEARSALLLVLLCLSCIALVEVLGFFRGVLVYAIAVICGELFGRGRVRRR